MEVDVPSSVLLPIADEVQDTPNLTQDQMSAYTRAIANQASGSSATTYPYPQHAPRVFDDSIARALSDALSTHIVPAAQSAGGSHSFITPEKAQLRMEVQSLHQQLAGTQMQALDALEMQKHQARYELDSQRQMVATEAQASMAVVASEAGRVQASNKVVLHDAALRLQSESQEISILRTELSGRFVSDSLNVQSEVIQMHTLVERTENALIEQRNTFSAESQVWQRNEQAEMGKLRSEHQVYMQSLEQCKLELARTQQSLKLEQDKHAQAHLQLVDFQSRLNASDLQARQLQSEVATRDTRIQYLDQVVASGSSPGNMQTQIELAVQKATFDIQTANQAVIAELERTFGLRQQDLISKCEIRCNEAKTEAEQATKSVFHKEMCDMQEEVQECYAKMLKKEEEEKAKASASSAIPTSGAEQLVLAPDTTPKAGDSHAEGEEKGELVPPELKFGKWPTPHDFTQWLHTWHMQISHAARQPDHAYKWIKKAKEAASYEELSDTEGYPRLDSRICALVHSQFQGELKREVRLLGIKNEQVTGKLLNGRQLCWIMYDSLDRTQLEGAIHTVDDLLQLELYGQKLREYSNSWDDILESLSQHPDLVPSNAVLESLYLKQIRKYDGLRLSIQKYDDDVTMNGEPRDLDRLKKIVRVSIQQKKLKANNQKYALGSEQRSATPVGPRADQRHKSPSGKGSGKERRGKTPDSAKKSQSDCYAWVKKGNCFRGDECPYDHDQSKKGSGRGRSRETSRDKGKAKGKGDGKKSSGRDKSPGRPRTGKEYSGPKGTAPSGKKDCQPCKNWLKGTCSGKDKCNFWHTPLCHKYAEGSCTRTNCIYKHSKKASPAVDKAKSKKAKEKKKKLAHHKGMIAKLEADSGEDDDDQPEEEDQSDQESQEEEQANDSSAEDPEDWEQEDE